MNSKLVSALVWVAVMSVLAGCHSNNAAQSLSSDPWQNAERIVARIKPPIFPARDFDVTTYGAVAGGEADNTGAFRSAIQACHDAGGGRVVVPAGVFLSGPIHLKSGVNLHLKEGSTIRFIYAFEETDFAITGTGTLDGQGEVWHRWIKQSDADIRTLVKMAKDNVPVNERVFGEGHKLRPNFIQPVRCRNVLIEGVRVINSPMWTLNPVYCTNVTIRGVTVETDGPNSDGCDPDSCTDVLIEKCVFSNGDDCIAVKSGRDEDGRRVNIPCENVVIRDCVFKNGHGGVTMGSETAGGIRNVFAERCHFDSPDLDMAMRFKTNPARGGYIENIFLRDCTVKTAKYGIHITKRYGAGVTKDGDTDPAVRNIEIRNSKFGTLTKGAIFVQGFSPDKIVTDVRIEGCEFQPMKNAVTITNAARVNIVGCTGL